MKRTLAQQEASRRNGSKSNGPRRPGASQNAVKSGIHSNNPLLESLGESKEQRIAMLDQYLHSINPGNRLELAAVEALFLAEVRMERVSRHECVVTERLLNQTNGDLGEAVLLSGNTRGTSLNSLSAQGTAALNRYIRSYRLLKDLRTDPVKLESTPETIPAAEEILDRMISRRNIQNKPGNPQPAENIIQNGSKEGGKDALAASRIAQSVLAVVAGTILLLSAAFDRSGTSPQPISAWASRMIHCRCASSTELSA